MGVVFGVCERYLEEERHARHVDAAAADALHDAHDHDGGERVAEAEPDGAAAQEDEAWRVMVVGGMGGRLGASATHSCLSFNIPTFTRQYARTHR